MEEVRCQPCGCEMPMTWQSPVYGDQQTYRFNCPQCGGTVTMQREGRKWRQIKLDGNHEEYRPKAYQADDQVELEERSVFQVGRILSPEEQAARDREWDEQQRQEAQARQRSMTAQANAQAQALAEAQQMAANAQQRAVQQRYLMALRQRGLPVPMPVQQPVAFTLGQHPNPAVVNVAQLRARLLGGQHP